MKRIVMMVGVRRVDKTGVVSWCRPRVEWRQQLEIDVLRAVLRHVNVLDRCQGVEEFSDFAEIQCL